MDNENKMGITPSSELWLLKLPELDPSYKNTYYFVDKGSQLKFFMSRKYGDTLTNYTYLRKDNAIRIDRHIDSIYPVNYIMYKNKNNKWYFAFIMDKIYINERVTELIISTDVIQSYMFDYILKESYIDRCHVDRWTRDGRPTPEYEPEGLEFGDHTQIDTQRIYTMKKTYVAVCSNPLGTLTNRRIIEGGQGGGDDLECGNWKDGYISADGFRFIKGFEGFATLPYQYQGDVPTIGYGTTKDYNPKEFEQLYNGGKGCTEEEASIVFYNKLTESYNKKVVDKLKEYGITEQSQADALFSLAYNAGIYDVIRDNELTRVIRANPKSEVLIRPVWQEFRIRKGTIFEKGLRERRREEVNMYFGKYSKRPIAKIPAGTGIVQENNGDGWMPDCAKTFIAEGESWQYPIRNNTGTITSLYGMRKHPISGQYKLHSGIDIGCPMDTPIYATKDGEVIVAGDNGDGYGKKIRLRHNNIEMETWYCHNNVLKVKQGEQVKAGQVIALAGTTGLSTGVHLHYELRVKDYATKETSRNPIPHLRVGDKI